MERNRSFNIPDKKYYTGGVKGTGKTLGLTNGTKNFGIGQSTFYGINAVFANSAVFNVNVGTNLSTLETSQSLGVVSDASKSGIIVEPDTQISMIIKF